MPANMQPDFTSYMSTKHIKTAVYVRKSIVNLPASVHNLTDQQYYTGT